MSKLDEKFIKDIEKQILQITSDGDQLILRIINFFVFWKIYHEQFDFESKELNEWIEKALNDQNQSYPTSSIGILLALVGDDYAKLAKYVSIEEKTTIMNFFSEDDNEKHSELKKNICHHLTYLISKQMKVSFPINFYNNTEFSIYFSHGGNHIIPSRFLSKDFITFEKIFVKFYDQFFRKIVTVNINFVDVNEFYQFENFVMVYEVIGANSELFSSYSLVIRRNSKTMVSFFTMILKESYQNSNEYINMFKNLCYFSTFLANIEDNLLETETETRLSLEQVESIFQKANELLIFLKQKCMRSKKKRVFDIKIKSMEIQLALNNKQKRIQLSRQFVNFIFPVCFDDQLLVTCLVTIFIDFQSQIEETQGYCFEGFYFRDAYQRFCEQLIGSNGMNVFYENQILLRMLIKIKIKKNKIEQGFGYLMLVPEIIGQTNYSFEIKSSTYLQLAFLSFYESVDDDFLYSKYYQLINNKQNITKFIRIISIIYFRINQKLSMGQRMLCLYRIALNAFSVETYCCLSLRFEIFDQAIKICLYKNWKQKRILIRKRDLYCSIAIGLFSDDWTVMNKKLIEKINKLRVQSKLTQKNKNYYQILLQTDEHNIF